jgi:hypothetical protein
MASMGTKPANALRPIKRVYHVDFDDDSSPDGLPPISCIPSSAVSWSPRYQGSLKKPPMTASLPSQRSSEYFPASLSAGQGTHSAPQQMIPNCIFISPTNGPVLASVSPEDACFSSQPWNNTNTSFDAARMDTCKNDSSYGYFTLGQPKTDLIYKSAVSVVTSTPAGASSPVLVALPEVALQPMASRQATPKAQLPRPQQWYAMNPPSIAANPSLRDNFSPNILDSDKGQIPRQEGQHDFSRQSGTLQQHFIQTPNSIPQQFSLQSQQPSYYVYGKEGRPMALDAQPLDEPDRMTSENRSIPPMLKVQGDNTQGNIFVEKGGHASGMGESSEEAIYPVIYPRDTPEDEPPLITWNKNREEDHGTLLVQRGKSSMVVRIPVREEKKAKIEPNPTASAFYNILMVIILLAAAIWAYLH